jgi:hypothetical protein
MTALLGTHSGDPDILDTYTLGCILLRSGFCSLFLCDVQSRQRRGRMFPHHHSWSSDSSTVENMSMIKDTEDMFVYYESICRRNVAVKRKRC